LAKTVPDTVWPDLPDLYADARDLATGALTDHGEAEAAAALPTTCPYDLDHITGNWLPD
jgi:hypothetical protein